MREHPSLIGGRSEKRNFRGARTLLECITVDSKEQITVIFVGGLKVVQPLID